VELRAGGPAVQNAAFDWDVLPDGVADWRQRGDELTFVGPPNQEYRIKLLAIRIIDGKPHIDRAVKVVRIGEAPPVPPGPGPTPPPTPVPPADPLFPAIQAMYGADTSPTKQADAKKLAAVFRQAGLTTVNDAALATTGALFAVVANAARAVVPLPALQPLRETVAKELQVKLGTDPAKPLDAATRKLCGDQFARVAGLLDGVAK
jgi:hypothetical protein